MQIEIKSLLDVFGNDFGFRIEEKNANTLTSQIFIYVCNNSHRMIIMEIHECSFMEKNHKLQPILLTNLIRI